MIRCKNCGGELLLQNGITICKSCGATFVLDSVYENVDVYICYEENDSTGRRTKDSIVAQEIYKKLEDSKISTFYERISADGMTGSDLEESKLAAMYRAKIIIVLGTSVESFAAIEAKYSEHFNEKAVVPFCVDVNPSAIPKTLSKIQAMSYSTIGWDQDLIKGICNILDRTPELDTSSLYGRRKRTIFIFATIVVVVIAIISMIVWIYLKPSNIVETPNTSQSQETTEALEKPLTRSEIYEKAQALLNSGKYLEAAEEFNKVFDYKDSASQIKKIYDRYDGYYQDEEETFSLYLNIIDGRTVEFSLEKTIDYKVIKVQDSMVLESNKATGNYLDNFLNTGEISIVLTNDLINFSVSTEASVDAVSFGNINVQFQRESKSDRPPIKTVTKELLLSWINSKTTINNIKEFGYELNYRGDFPVGSSYSGYGFYEIVNTEILIYTTNEDISQYRGEDLYNRGFELPKLDDYLVVAIIAPINLICPEKIGESSNVFSEEDIVYVPYSCTFDDMSDDNWQNHHFGFGTIKEEIIIKSDTTIGFSSKKLLGDYNYNSIIDVNLKNFYKLQQTSMLNIAQSSVESEVKSKYKLDSPSVSVVTQNDTHILFSVKITSDCCAWYKYDRKSQKATFVKEGPYQAEGNKISKTLWFAEYMDFAKEFPQLFDATVGTASWDKAVKEAIIEKAVDLAEAKYSEGLSYNDPYQVVTENDTHILICVDPREIHLYEGAWYKGNKQTGEVVFLRQGPYIEVLYWNWSGNTGIVENRIAEYLWFKEYSDFANEFPAFYGTPNNEGIRYSTQLPYSISFDSEDEEYSIFSGPTYDSDYVGNLPDGNNTIVIVEHQYDEDYNFWGKLSTGEGWVCLSSIWEELEREGLEWECNKEE